MTVEKKTKDKVYLIGSILLMAVSYLVMLSKSTALTAETGVTMLDISFGYSSEVFYKAVKQLGYEGIDAHISLHLLDYFFVLGYALTMMCVTTRVCKNKVLVCAIPLATAVFDVLENASLDIAMTKYPTVVNGTVAFASTMTLLKWIGTFGWTVFFIVMLIKYLRDKKIMGSDLAADAAKSIRQLAEDISKVEEVKKKPVQSAYPLIIGKYRLKKRKGHISIR